MLLWAAVALWTARIARSAPNAAAPPPTPRVGIAPPPTGGLSAVYDQAAASTRELLARLIEADTTNPPGNEARAVAIAADELRRDNIPYEVTTFAPNRQNLVARLEGDGTEKPLLLLAHIDVVGTSGQTWTTDPHTLTERDGYLIGRGAIDDLGMAAVELRVLQLLKRTGVKLRRDVILAWTGDEESGGAGIRWLLANRKASIEAELALNEGGSIVLGDDGRVKLVQFQAGEKTYQDFQLVAKGETGHSSVPRDDNAITRLGRALERVGQFKFPVRLLPLTRAYLATRAALEPPTLAKAMRQLAQSGRVVSPDAVAVVDGHPAKRTILRTTCVATWVQGGTRVNSLPAEASANLNCRILPGETPEQVAAQLTRVIGDPRIELRPVSPAHASPPSPEQGIGPSAITKVVGAMWPAIPAIPFLESGASDGRFLRTAGIPTYGVDPFPMKEEDAQRMHGADERLPLTSLRTGVELFHRLVVELAAAR